MTIRTKYLEPDYRHESRRDPCCRCGKQIKNVVTARRVHLISGGHIVLHPEDEPLYVPDGGDVGCHPIGPDCARILGLEWSVP